GRTRSRRPRSFRLGGLRDRGGSEVGRRVLRRRRLLRLRLGLGGRRRRILRGILLRGVLGAVLARGRPGGRSRRCARALRGILGAVLVDRRLGGGLLLVLVRLRLGRSRRLQRSGGGRLGAGIDQDRLAEVGVRQQRRALGLRAQARQEHAVGRIRVGV